MINKTENISVGRIIEELRTVATNVKSERVIRDTSAVPLSNSIIRLPKAGSIITKACGNITNRVLCQGVILRAIAASVCPLGTEIIVLRTISDP